LSAGGTEAGKQKSDGYAAKKRPTTEEAGKSIKIFCKTGKERKVNEKRVE